MNGRGKVRRLELGLVGGTGWQQALGGSCSVSYFYVGATSTSKLNLGFILRLELRYRGYQKYIRLLYRPCFDGWLTTQPVVSQLLSMCLGQRGRARRWG